METLLLLNGEIYDQGNGYWIKIEAWRVEANQHVPHGVRYALTLHDRYGMRLLGFDNAHAVKPPKRKRYACRRVAYDHRHRHARDKGVRYEFTVRSSCLKIFSTMSIASSRKQSHEKNGHRHRIPAGHPRPRAVHRARRASASCQ